MPGDVDAVLDRLSAPQTKCWLCLNPEAGDSVVALVTERIKCGKPIVWRAIHEIYHNPEQYGLDLPRVLIKDPRAVADHVRAHAGVSVPGDGRGNKNR